MDLIVLNDQDVEKLVSFEENMQMIEDAFAGYQTGKSKVFPVIREEIQKHHGIFGIKSGYLEDQEVLGFKAGGFWADNKNLGLTNHQSAMLLFDPESGRPCAILAANFITKLRTGALGAIGCKYLARPDSKILAIIGAGQQGRNQLQASLNVLPNIKEIYVYDRYRPAAEALAKDFSAAGRTGKAVTTAAEACRNADVIVTATSNYEPIVMADWIKPGTHINAVGTDTRGKQELDPKLFALADKVVVDNLDQCLYLGECQHAYDAGLISRDTVHAEIGEVIRKTKSARVGDREITIFDTTGVAIQDLATAGFAVKQAIAAGMGTKVSL